MALLIASRKLQWLVIIYFFVSISLRLKNPIIKKIILFLSSYFAKFNHYNSG